MPDFNLGNVVGLLKSEVEPDKKYVIWAHILNPTFPDIVELKTWDEIAGDWRPIQDSNTNYFLKAVISKDLTAPPGGPLEGDRYLIAAAATGAWAGKSDKIATWHLGAWQYTTPLDGYILPVRTDANQLQEYRGTYGAGGAWFEYDFTVPVPPGTYIPNTEKAAALGVATLNEDTKIPAEQIDGESLPFEPINPPDWPGTVDTVWEAIEYIRNLVSGGGSVPPGTVIFVTKYNASLTNLYPVAGLGPGGVIRKGDRFTVSVASAADIDGNIKFTKGMSLLALATYGTGEWDNLVMDNNWERNSAGQYGPDA